jgi:polyribonucleotide nucleotidyltransferase
VLIGSTDPEAARKAIAMVENLTRDVEVNSVYTGKVTRIFGYGALVEVLPGKEGLVHISELADYRVPSAEEVVKLGDEIMVKVIDIDRQGKISLSRRAVFQESTETAGEPKQGLSSAPTRPPASRSRPDTQRTERKPSDSSRYHRPRS